MAPILEKMTSQQLVQLYREAGNTQREKMLKALSSDRAARLITEVML
jgi:Mg/Co/Ni transporter MgtE